MQDIIKNFDVSRFLDSLQYMWKGMLGIFIVILVIILAVYAMNLVIGKIEKKKQMKAEREDN